MTNSLDKAYEAALAAAKPRKASLKALEAKWTKLREQYLVASKAILDLDVALSVRYGQTRWASRGETQKLDKLRARREKVSSKIFEILHTVSPRNWESGAPSHWICEKLSWQDAIRPLNEPLSVAPPLAYGATHPMR